MPVLRVRENAPTARLSAQINLNAAATATTVTPKLIQGPHSIAPAITATARRGKNNLPTTTLVFESNPVFPKILFRFDCGFLALRGRRFVHILDPGEMDNHLRRKLRMISLPA